MWRVAIIVLQQLLLGHLKQRNVDTGVGEDSDHGGNDAEEKRTGALGGAHAARCMVDAGVAAARGHRQTRPDRVERIEEELLA